MKKFFLALFLLSVFSASALANQSVPDNKNTQGLFVMLAKEASIKSGPQSGVYRLTLKGVNPNVVYFANRPERISGHILTQKFIQQWQGSGTFNKVIPNAMMEAVKLNAQTNKLQNSFSSYAIELAHPVVNKQNEITFDVKTLPGSKAAIANLTNSDYVAIFIDDVCISCIG